MNGKPKVSDLYSTVVVDVAPAEPRSPKSALLDRIYQDFNTRRATGEIIDPDEYCRQFPGLKSSLFRMIECHQFLEDNVHLLADDTQIDWPEPGEGYMGFHLVQELGRGTFARVFLARQPKLGDRLVVIKIAKHGNVEARIMGRIDHPNVVPVFSVQDDLETGVAVVCMPYLGDATLCDVLDNVDERVVGEHRASSILDSIAQAARGTPPEPKSGPRLAARVLRRGSYVDGVRHIAVQLLEALAYIHERGIFHRDLKPSNVLMTPQGVPMLLDFNLSADVRLTSTLVGGTFPYMPPEQLQPYVENGRFDPASLQARSDLFSLAVILYQLLTGSHPFGHIPVKCANRDLCDLLERQRHGAVHVSDLNPQVDREFGDVIQRCLAFAPKDRPESAAESAKTLRRGLTPLGRARRWIGRHSRAVLAAGLLLAALSGSAAVVATQRPSFSERQVQTAMVHYGQGRYPEALDLFSAALLSEPGNASTWYARGRTHQQLGSQDKEQYHEAIKDYLKANELAATNAELGRNLAAIGYCYSMLGEHKPAIRHYEDSIQAGFVSAEVCNNLGYAQMARKLEQAPQQLDRAIQLDPNLSAAYHNRAMYALEKAHWAATHLDSKREPHSLVGKEASPATLEQLRSQVVLHLHTAMDDVEKAIQLARPTAELRYDAACICSYAAERLDGKWRERALENLTAAVKEGTHRKLADEAYFSALRNDPRFGALVVVPPPAGPEPPTQRVVNPIPRFPN